MREMNRSQKSKGARRAGAHKGDEVDSSLPHQSIDFAFAPGETDLIRARATMLGSPCDTHPCSCCREATRLGGDGDMSSPTSLQSS